MKLLGPYNSLLQSFHYQELLNLYKTAIAAGGFSGNKTFDTSTINTLIQQSQDFSTLPLASAGQLATDDTFNNPMNLLTARYNAINSEASNFASRAAGLLEVLQKDTGLLDMLISAANLQSWIDTIPLLRLSTHFSWDYGMGNGPTSLQIEKTDPINSVLYPTNCPTNTYLDCVDGSTFTGLAAPEITSTISPQSLRWRWTKMTAGEQSEDLYGVDWAELNLLEDHAILNFLPNPAVTVILPLAGTVNGVFNVSGQITGGSIPIFVRTLFVPRRNITVLRSQNAISDASFDLGGASWTFGGGWSLANDGNAHSGSNYASKAVLTTWSSLTTYNVNNLVSYQGKNYISKSTNINSLPNAPGSTDWDVDGILSSPVFPLNPLDTIYIESWLKSLSADGIVTVSLVCLDHNGAPITPSVPMPGISSAQDYVMTSGTLQALNDSSVVSGRIDISVFGQTTGHWAFDDIRIHLPQNLSQYKVNQDEVSVYIPLDNSTVPNTIYFENSDFIVDDISNVTLMNVPDGTSFTVRYTENYPAYQCSVNESVWSPVIMLDPSRPYPDSEKSFNPIALSSDDQGLRTLFPITDEQGVPTGLTLKMISRPLFEYYFQVSTPATPQYGVTAVLEVDLSRPTYMNGLTIAPFSTYPLKLVQVDTESFTSDTRQTVGAPNALIDRPMVLTFPTTLLSRIYLTFYQENYTLSELIAQPPDALRRDVLYSLQSVLPFKVRRPSRAVPVYYRGAQYTMGVENISGVTTTPILPGVFIAGPHHFTGCPDVFRFDADVIDPSSIDEFDVYLCWKAYNSSGIIEHSELNGIEIEEGDCRVFPFPNHSLLDRSLIDHVDIFLKFVIRDPEVILQRYLLQVSNAS
jgi:hypothetical protein